MFGELLIQTLEEGCVYALMALGLTTIYNATKVINFGQGEFFVLGAALMYTLSAVNGWSPAIAIVLTIAGAVVMSLVSERLIMLPVIRSGSHHAWIIATLALALIFEALFALYYHDATLRPDPLVTGSFTVLGTVVSAQQVLLVLSTAAVAIAYGVFLKRTAFGRAVQATGYDSDTAQLMGVSSRTVIIASFVIGGVVTAIGGMLIAPLYFITPTSGLVYVMGGFIAMIIGGLGSVAGSIAGGITVGFLYSAVANLVDSAYSQITVVALLVTILIVRPQGVFKSPVAHGGHR